MNPNKSLLRSTNNTRDIGGYQCKNGNLTRRNVLIRSDVILEPSKEDIAFLKEHKITTIIDMRGMEEVSKNPNGLAKAEGFRYINCPIDEGADIPAAMELVPASYMKIACSPSMSRIFKTISNAENGVLYHCTAGKDRTGVVSAILLSHAGVSDLDIIENYVVTKEFQQNKFVLIHKKYPELDMRIVTPCEWYMEEFLRLFRKHFTDTLKYFETIGLSEKQIDKIDEKLGGCEWKYWI